MNSYPLQHISIRVPWHDLGWNGTICACPSRNTSCLKLKNISDNMNLSQEENLAGKFLNTISPSYYPPCVKERVTFMANFAFERDHQHPYANLNNNTHTHFATTRLRYPAYGAAALPFRWMMKPVVFGDNTGTTPLL